MKLYEKYRDRELDKLKQEYEGKVEAVNNNWDDFSDTGNCSIIDCDNCPFDNETNYCCGSKSARAEKLNEEV